MSGSPPSASVVAPVRLSFCVCVSVLGVLAILPGCGAPAATAPPAIPAAAGTVRGALAHPSPSAPVALTCPRADRLALDAVTEEVVCLLRHYLRLDTTNPPGNEHLATAFLTDFLAREGIESRVVEAAKGRTNLIARLPAARPATPSKPAVMVVHHMDVVPASEGEWEHPPLSGALVDGHVWGRGSLDNKGPGIVELVALAMLKRLSVPLDRDVVLLAVADEEAGSGHGARYLVAHHPEWFEDVGFVLNEGGAIVTAPGQPAAYRVELAQKAPLWLRLRARGPSGHGSRPEPAAATHVLVRALSRLERYRFPVKVVPAVGAYYAAQARGLPEGTERTRLADLERSLLDPAYAREFLSDPSRAALVQNTLSITMLAGSDKENVMAPEAVAVLDMRLLPGEDPAAVTATVASVLAEPAVEVETLLSWQAHASSADTPLFAAIRRLASERDPGTEVMASVIGGFTDCNAFRAAGMTCYGFLPMRIAPALFGGVHGKNERIAVATLGQGVVDLVALLRLLD